MPYVKISRDKRGYETFFLLEPGGPGQSRPRVLFSFRTPPQIKIGREPFSEEIRQDIEAQYPNLRFDWPRLTATSAPSPEAERWRERRRQERAARQAAARQTAARDSGRQQDAGRQTGPETGVGPEVEEGPADDAAEAFEEAQPAETSEDQHDRRDIAQTAAGPAVADAQASEAGGASSLHPGRRRRRRRRGRRGGVPQPATPGTAQEPTSSEPPTAISEQQSANRETEDS